MTHRSRAAFSFALLALLGAGAVAHFGDFKLAAVPVVLLLAAWLVVDWLLYKPLAVLNSELAYLARTKGKARLPVFPSRHLLGDLVPTSKWLAESLTASQIEFDRQLDQATKQSEEQKRWLEVILVDLSEGVLVCNLNHQLLLYNQTVTHLFDSQEAIGLGRPLFALVAPEPVKHTLELLEHKRQAGHPGGVGTLPFLCPTADGKRLLEGHMGLILDADGKASAYVLTFADMSGRIEELADAGLVRRAFTRDLRRPVANLRLAAETLEAHRKSMTVEQRDAFESVVFAESKALSDKIEELAGVYRGHALGRWPMAELSAADLLSFLDRQLRAAGGPSVTLVGMPQWLHADHYLLYLLLARLSKKLAERFGVSGLDAETKLAGKRVYLDLIWTGGVIADSEIKAWLAEPLIEGGKGLAIGDALDRHGAEIWCQAESEKRSLLRLPLPLLANAAEHKTVEEAQAARPEFYDFGLLAQHADAGNLAERKLRSLTFVVFDTETTGLRPSQGDEIISIGAARVVNGRLLSGETFQRMVNPGRKIPEESIKYHHITDDMVKDMPTISVVLPQFKAFAGDAVLAAHNAAFDLKFLHMKEKATGIHFTNPVVDTLLLSRLADQHLQDHSLDGIAERFNIEIPERHTALGDALATALVLVRLIEILESQDIATLGQVMRLTNMAAQVKANQQQF